MSRRSIGDQANIGPGNIGQPGNIARLAGAHFDHGMAMLFIQPGQRQRHAQLVVVIALGGQHFGTAPQTAASISLTVVFPLLPVTPITLTFRLRRQARAISPMARATSATTSCGSPSSTGCATSAAAAPA